MEIIYTNIKVEEMVYMSSPRLVRSTPSRTMDRLVSWANPGQQKNMPASNVLAVAVVSCGHLKSVIIMIKRANGLAVTVVRWQ